MNNAINVESDKQIPGRNVEKQIMNYLCNRAKNASNSQN